MQTAIDSTATVRRRSFLTALAAGAAGLLALPARLLGKLRAGRPTENATRLCIRRHPDAVSRSTGGSSTHA